MTLAKTALCRRSAVAAWAALAVAALALTAAPPARAETDAARASYLFEEGRKDLAAGEVEKACVDFRESLRLEPKVGTALNVVECEERLGHLAAARNAAAQATSIAKDQSDDRLDYASKRLAELEPKVGRLEIAQKGVGCTLSSVTLDGTAVDLAKLAEPLVVDPGHHLIAATAPKCTLVRVEVDAAATETKRVELALAVIPDAPPPSRSKVPAIVAGAAGVVGIGVGTYFGLSAISDKSDSDAFCNGNACKQQGLDLRDDAKTAATVSTVGFIVGIACLGAAAYLWFFAPGAPAPAQTGKSALGSPFVYAW